MKRLIFLLVLALVAAAPAARAAEPAAKSGDRVVFKKKTVIDLTGSVIEGELTRPEGSYVVARKVSRFSSLITVRQSFLPELLASPDRL